MQQPHPTEHLIKNKAMENENVSKVLHLTLKKYWFDMIKSGVKKEEYREIKGYWVKRLVEKIEQYHSENCLNRIGFNTVFKEFSEVVFKNGYAKDAQVMRVECKGIRIGKPKVEWCVDAIEFDQDNGNYDDCFIIELGSVLS